MTLGEMSNRQKRSRAKALKVNGKEEKYLAEPDGTLWQNFCLSS